MKTINRKLEHRCLCKIQTNRLTLSVVSSFHGGKKKDNFKPCLTNYKQLVNVSKLWCECEYDVTVRTRRSSVIRCHDDDCYRATNLSYYQHFSILMLKDAAHRGYLFVFCAKYRISQAPYSTQRIRDTLFFHIFPVKNNSEA